MDFCRSHALVGPVEPIWNDGPLLAWVLWWKQANFLKEWYGLDLEIQWRIQSATRRSQLHQRRIIVNLWPVLRFAFRFFIRSPGGSASTPLCSRSRVLFHLALTARGVDKDSSLSLCRLVALKVTTCGNDRAFPGRSDIQSNEVAIFEMSDGGVQLTPNFIVDI